MGTESLKILTVGDIAGDFFVPSYQRGYRWTEHEVTQLLDDIRESGGSTYYLQPVVVKHREDGSWELVDGQQRLTTLHLIFRYLRTSHLPTASANYSITYETRPGSKDYLETLDEDRAGENIDFFHLYRAHRCIEGWFSRFEHRTTHEATRFYGYLFDSVKVLWYKAPAEVDSTDLFTRLNVGRIPLTDAELVKALLLSHGKPGAGLTDRAVEIAANWDGIERDLRTPELWAFVTGEADEEATHISLLLDTLAGGPRGPDRPVFHTFETLRGPIQEDPYTFWRDVVDLHSMVLGWYEDRDLFHKVGFLIATGRSFQELRAISREKGRSAFEAALNERIREHLKLTASQLTELSYGSARKTSDALLLMNIETIRAMQGSAERYSFRAHAAGAWSLEHIHAQNAEDLTTVQQWTAWLAFHRSALVDLPDLEGAERQRLLDLIDHTLATEVTQQSFSAAEKEVMKAFSQGEADESDNHAISNLALLDLDDNAALNNSVFEVKRREIIRRDRAGSYIPACTRNVFLKYYTPAGEQQLHYWSAADRGAYVEAIGEALAPYLTPEEVP